MKPNELLYCKHQTDMDLGHKIEWKLAYRPFACGDGESGLRKQVILIDVSHF